MAKTIQQFDHGDGLISSDELKQIEAEILNQQIDARYPCSVDCQQIISDLTVIMRKIANAVPTNDTQPLKAAPVMTYSPVKPTPPIIVEKKRGIPWWGAALLTLVGAGAGVGGKALYDQYRQNR